MWFAHISTLGGQDPDLAVIDGLSGGAAYLSFGLSQGERAARSFPANARLHLREEHSGIRLSSVLSNLSQLLIVRTELRALIERHCFGQDIEYLPVTLHDHRGRIYSRDYTIVNPIGALDCLAEEASGLVLGTLPCVEKIVLDSQKLGAAPQLFRIKHLPDTYVFGLALARAMKDADLSNVFLTRLDVLGQDGSP